MPDEIAALDMAFTDGILMGLGPRARLFDGQEAARAGGRLRPVPL